MAFLPSTPLTLTGGCHCGAARYTIAIPALADRPRIPNALPTPTSATSSIPATFPIVTLDHCATCRHTTGAIVTCWFIVPPSWLTWSITTKSGSVLANQPTVAVVGPRHDTSPPPAKNSTNDENETYVQQYAASPRALRSFCGRCGTNLTYYNLDRHDTPAAFVDVTVGSLDDGSLAVVRPERHGWWDSGFGWIREMLRFGTGEWVIRNPTGDPGRRVGDVEGNGEGKDGAWLEGVRMSDSV
ncbi:uncharacterized protein HMPREF1541_09858 [Cyphellophora europaea CBS 101466]|uniref:Uncharacterized protein n=1 Tax=Cyphellophora europaea (strain CBS 101466) TaxID=1220924 RepID=W2S8I6_CYPE1|nr:uncharacterized protein HMPREF1541_09858 [Cyphellophora europaea CBS 101466]ETN44982.1 hypothetical protein HMPREF1541_09858 [Cyphellophora europaea CBS 101466]